MRHLHYFPQTEDVAPQHRRREFISGFRGSRGTILLSLLKLFLIIKKRKEFFSIFNLQQICILGTAVITNKKAALWTDGRYFVQANMELDCNWILQKEGNIVRFSVITEQKMLDKFLRKQKRIKLSLALLAKAKSRKMVLIKMDLDMSPHNIVAKRQCIVGRFVH